MPMNSAEKKKKSWWRKILANKKSPSDDSISNSSSINKFKIQKWRNLSPDEPPLPFLLQRSYSTNKNVVAASIIRSCFRSSSCSKSPDNEKMMLAPSCLSFLPKLPKKVKFKNNQQQEQQQQNEIVPSAPVYIPLQQTDLELYTISEASDENTTISCSDACSISTPDDASSTLSIHSPPVEQAAEATEEELEQDHEQATEEEPTAEEEEQEQEQETEIPKIITIAPVIIKEEYSIILPPSLSSSSTSYSSSSNNNRFSSGSGSDVNNSTTIQSPSSSNNNIVEYIPISDWSFLYDIKELEPTFDPHLINNEAACKIVFCQLLESALKNHNDTKKMQFLFNPQGNIGGIKMTYKDGTRQDFVQFGGNIQYIPPELLRNSTYSHELVNVWALGISLYRMLIGRYPFFVTGSISSDKELFKMMAKCYYSILPTTLSTEVKNLLRLMLAPKNKRASLDLVMFHPWIQAQLEENLCSSYRQPVRLTVEKATKKRTKLLKMMKRVIRVVLKGPYPPPKHHYYPRCYT